MSRYYGSNTNRNSNSNTKAVYLNVYDLIEQNEYLYPIGFGAYHSGN